MSAKKALSAVIGGLLLIQGCSTRLVKPSATPHRDLSPAERALSDASCYGGLPVEHNRDVGPTELAIRQGYVLEFSSLDKTPIWVCESVSTGQLAGHLERDDAFRPDPDLKGPKSYPTDYAHSGYDRGHQAPAGNQTLDPALKSQTFYMSNMAPQRPSLNRGIWKQLEEKTRDWVRRYEHAYEWTGPIRCDAQLRAAVTRANSCQRETIGRNHVAVPVYFYKIILVQDQGNWKSIAFVMPNAIIKCPCRLNPYIVSIDEIERETGIEFMPNGGSRARRELKALRSSLWP